MPSVSEDQYRAGITRFCHLIYEKGYVASTDGNVSARPRLTNAQGAVMALEDGVVLARCLDKYSDVKTALQRYEDARLVRDNRMVAGANEMVRHFHNPDYRDPVKADAYIDREWSAEAINARYEWLFTYNVDTVEV